MAPHTIAVISGTSRTFQHLIPQALAKGHRVRAVVRSTSRFQAQTKKHDELTAHEWSDFTDIAGLKAILDGVDVVYVALTPPGKGKRASPLSITLTKSAKLQPSWINEDVVISIGTVLHDAIAPGSRSPTKVVLLTSAMARPDLPRSWVGETLLSAQFDDLRAAQEYLLKQRSWLDSVFIAPGALLDTESSDVMGVRLQAGGTPPAAISYARLAAAMQLGASQPEWYGKFVLPVPTEQVPQGLQLLRNLADLVGLNLVHRLLPAVAKTLVFVSLGAGVGYISGVRDGGALLRRYGLDVRA